MKITYFTASHQRANGVMGKSVGGEEIFVFVYPSSSLHIYHTFLCPPLRIVAVKNGKIVFDQPVKPNRFIVIPPSNLVLEMAVETDYRPYLPEIISGAPDRLPQSGGWDSSVPVDALLFALFAQSLSDLKRVAKIGPLELETMREHFHAWERGGLINAAEFLLDFKGIYEIPESAESLSELFLNVEVAYKDELRAAAVAGVPWKDNFPSTCMRCGRPAKWRTIIAPPKSAVPELAWRYKRPENAIPICRVCADNLGFNGDHGLQLDAIWGLWGYRFEALFRWHQALAEGVLPVWDKTAYPLWPPEYGGSTWHTGSGALKYAAPRPPVGIVRSDLHKAALKRVGYSRKRRGKPGGRDSLIDSLVNPKKPDQKEGK